MTSRQETRIVYFWSGMGEMAHATVYNVRRFHRINMNILYSIRIENGKLQGIMLQLPSPFPCNCFFSRTLSVSIVVDSKTSPQQVSVLLLKKDLPLREYTANRM